MQIHLTARLACLASSVPQNACLADIGTDHGYLPIFLWTQGRLKKIIASDLRQGPLASAQQNAVQFDCAQHISFRLGAGLTQISADECDTISIAGMGGETIAGILQQAPWTQTGNHLLLLQPMTMIPLLRQYLWQNGYEILAEQVCREGKRLYLILSVCGGAPKKTIDIEACYTSPALLKADGAKEYLQKLVHEQTKILSGITQSTQADKIITQKQIVQHLRAVLEELT